MSKNRKIIVFFVLFLIIILMAIIIYFSSRNGVASERESKTVLNKIIKILFNDNNGTSITKKQYEYYNFIIRKTAHFVLYCSMGILFSIFFRLINVNKIKSFLYALGCSLVFAITDEIHQIFSSGRTARVFDVFIDSCGSFLGICLVYIITYFILKCRKKSCKEE